MAILHVRNVPDEMYQRLQRLAEQRKRSLSAEVVTILERGIEEEERRSTQRELIEKIRRERFRYPEGTQVPDSYELLREDRAR